MIIFLVRFVSVIGTGGHQNCRIRGSAEPLKMREVADRNRQTNTRSRAREDKSWGCSLLLFLELLDVEIELAAFKDVTIKTARLSGAGGDAG